MRWTVSLHEVSEGFRRDSQDHLDWFFERDDGQKSGTLMTFASGLSPSDWQSESGISIVPADRLPDHRLIYLDYQGDISGDRGRITPILTGQFQWGTCETDDESTFEIELITIEIRNRSLAAMVPLAESWEAMLRLVPSVPIRLVLS